MGDRLAEPLQIGWAETDITPPQAVMLRGQFHVRISEGVRDPLTATVLLLEQAQAGVSAFVSCDLILISDGLRDAVRARLKGRIPGLDARRICLHATHTHTGPELSPMEGVPGIPPELMRFLDIMRPQEYVEFAAERISEAVMQAWEDRKPGGISWGLAEAVISHNRRWTSVTGTATMYGNVNVPHFAHVEGWEDHHLGVLCTWSEEGELTGVVVNVPCPAQVSEMEYHISADYWYETRRELRRRLGDGVYILPQCSPAGDLSPHHIVRKAESERRLKLKGQTRREEIAETLANAVTPLVAHLRHVIVWQPRLRHRVETLHLPRRQITAADVESASAESEQWKAQYEALVRAALGNPSLTENRRWYVEITKAYRRMRWYEGVRHEFERQHPELAVEVHIVRLGDIAIATNPFELYVDFGLQIQVQSPASHTFLVQLAGPGRYLPTARSVEGGGYGSSAASSIIGPEGGSELVRQSVALLNSLW